MGKIQTGVSFFDKDQYPGRMQPPVLNHIVNQMVEDGTLKFPKGRRDNNGRSTDAKVIDPKGDISDKR
jgi:hypothetical protein